MPEYLSPGVYVEEVDTGNKPIEGVSTSTAGFVGMTVRGPTSGLPVLVTSFPDFARKFGGYLQLTGSFLSHTYLPHAVEGFFTNGGKRLYIMRVVPSDATNATTTAKGGLLTRLQEDAPVAQTVLKPTTLRGINNGTIIQLQMIKDSVVTNSNELTVQSINRASGEITVNADITATPTGPAVFEARYTSVFTNVNFTLRDNGTLDTSIALSTSRSNDFNTFTISAKDKGSWGKEIIIQAFHESAAKAEMDAFVSGALDDNKIRLKSTAGFYPKAWVEIDRGNTKMYRRVKSVDGTVLTLEGEQLADTDVAPEAPATTTIFSTCEFRLTCSYGGVVEQFNNLTIENIPGRYYLDRINNTSALISVGAPPSQTHPFRFPSGVDGIRVWLDTNGSDGTNPPNDLDYVGGGLSGQRTGIKALEDIDQISIIAAPGITSQVVQNALITQCELLKDRFAVLDPNPKSGIVTSPDTAPSLDDIQKQRNLYDTKYAAIYYPRLRIYDPVTQTDISVPPSGHVVGIYARSDIEKGVHKAPANEVIRGITGLELTINKGEHDILNPSPVNINVLRDFRSAGRSYRVWGARVITSDSDWKYVPVRRLFIFIEESIEQGTQWVVFESNDEPLWARVRRSVSAFLTNVWRDGALQGRTKEEAFFVKCDRTTMSQYDIDNGRLIMLIGIAPVKPAEFVIFRIGQWTGGSSLEEV